ncbi:MAG: phosphatase [Candidatus Marinimicrobia bacterium]|jgi:exopolyphosphatase/guanosine-5'-triphosphate,3'-diphosphate pyrophosphatase|nr:phosphatase [Gammaproteobacteria bacterium]MBT4926406.1 phosphatase [Candidatus Neomarinimicrobiota bacterium]MDB4043026.1 phosphatase [Gammaproteobacteria bacterium]MDG1202856.1 phosphatase [SAR86 cluster bacterium]|tara:strand:- start:952 stop:1806 length:855 start_codon:yes stop_codon:yes gene_type:complete
MKIASIDIGTNAIKSKIFKTTPTSIEFLKGMRSPIRLGSEVFKNGKLSKVKLNQVIKTIQEFEEIFKTHLINRYEIVATSAFRDTSNSEDARRYIETAINHPLKIISGLEEAQLMRFHPKSNTGNKKIFVDLGGGSTEFFIRNVNGVEIRSFQLGAVRNMLKKDKKAEWRRMEQWLKSIKPKNKLIGIGGNIRSFLQLQDKKELSLKQFKRKSKELANYTTEEKILRYGFSPDRADVIDHSLEIYDVICTNLEIEKITSTKWGISDSIAVKLFHEIYSGKVEIS